MLIAAATLALTIAAAPPPMPPLVVNVTAARGISPTLVAKLLDEVDAIWRGTNITFLWHQQTRDAASPTRPRTTSPFGPPTLRVTIGNELGVSREGGWPLGWIVFEDDRPEQEIYVSFANAETLMRESVGVVGHLASMPRLQHETLLGRAMGRALAHEIGHYLSASKRHSPHGLMMAVHTAAELFGEARARFAIAPAEQQRMVTRLTSIYIASRG